MEIDLAEQSALILADNGPFVGPLEAELSRCGATVTIRDPALIDSQSLIADALKSAAASTSWCSFPRPCAGTRDRGRPPNQPSRLRRATSILL